MNAKMFVRKKFIKHKMIDFFFFENYNQKPQNNLIYR